MKLNLFCSLVIISGFYACGNKVTFPKQDMSFYDDYEKYHINSYQNSKYIDSLVKKFEGVDWELNDEELSKEHAVYYLYEATKIRNHCEEKSSSIYDIENLSIDYKKIRLIELKIVDSKFVYTYWIDKNLSTGKILEVREHGVNKFTIHCGFAID